MSSTQPYVPGFGAALAQSQLRRGSKWSELKIWWREVDRVLLGLILALMVIGTAAVAAGSPASARRLSTASEKLPDLYFYWIHLRWQFAGLLVMFGASALSRDNARRVGVVLAGAMLAALMLVPLIGYEVNGAKRWIRFGLGFQPSEFLKPGFAICLAWILSWRLRDPHLPVMAIVTAIMGLVGVLLMLQPDLGSAVLFGGVWFVMVMLSGVSMKKIGGMIGAGVVALTAAYFLYDNARHRIDAFLGGGSEFDQVGLAEKTLLGGGWTGTGFWLGLRKMSLPEAHTDYVFSVIGEEFGLLVCALVVMLYLAIIVRVLVRLADEENLFALLASAGLVTQIGGQAFINILVNLQLFPSKGMTLPLVSYGGSSTIAICLGVGLLLALTRRNPFLTRETPGLRAILMERGITDKEKGA
ncbi:putative lipid II flippase FtsW [Erythrobacter sp. SDW2]|uniref:FtsW/RodA/SpoVE family cell cycle protein n=1 Tax=Erythrobacter sp. SDW2 TaxID=2907154 RepID=UPI001F40924D|nr:putative peptidoglycan glycosyltransferase FtsW [Erythrobacter sp. SDW2]UIP06485.1 putative lipid II flippase FtsW [Erythrobacter sp. SDW2]